MKEQTICMQEDCAMRNTRLWNKCDALEQAYEFGEICPFYKSEDKWLEEIAQRQARAKYDSDFAALCRYYGKAKGYRHD